MATFGYTSIGASNVGITQTSKIDPFGRGSLASSAMSGEIESMSAAFSSNLPTPGTFFDLKFFISNSDRTETLLNSISPIFNAQYSDFYSSAYPPIGTWATQSYETRPSVNDSITYGLFVIEAGANVGSSLSHRFDSVTPDVSFFGSTITGMWPPPSWDEPNAATYSPAGNFGYGGIISIYATYAEAPPVELPTVVTHAITNIEPMS